MKIKSLAILSIALGILAFGCAMAQADAGVPVDAGLVLDAGAPPDASLPSDQLADPIADPVGAVGDSRDAVSKGWALGILAILVTLVKGLTSAGKKWPTVGVLRWLRENQAAVLVSGCLGVAIVGAYNALALGGSGWAVLYAAAGAVFLFMQSPTPRVSA